MKWLWHSSGSWSRLSSGASGVCCRAADLRGRHRAPALQNTIRPDRTLACVALRIHEDTEGA